MHASIKSDPAFYIAMNRLVVRGVNVCRGDKSMLGSDAIRYKRRNDKEWVPVGAMHPRHAEHFAAKMEPTLAEPIINVD